MKKLYIYCAGGLGCEVMMLARRVHEKTPAYACISFIDDTMENQPLQGVPTLTYKAFSQKADRSACRIVIANGEPAVREMLCNKIKQDGFELETLIDPLAVVSDLSSVKQGCVIMSGACLDPGIVIEENSLLYYNTTVAHDSVVGAHSVLSIGAIVSGHCAVGKRTFLGAASALRDRVCVGDDCIIGIGSVVLENIESNSVVYGLPGRIMRDNTSHRVFI